MTVFDTAFVCHIEWKARRVSGMITLQWFPHLTSHWICIIDAEDGVGIPVFMQKQYMKMTHKEMETVEGREDESYS